MIFLSIKINKIKIQKIIENPKVGVINGLWACDYGTGGVVPIEVVFHIRMKNLILF